MRWGAMQFFNDAREVDQLFPQQHFFSPITFSKIFVPRPLAFCSGKSFFISLQNLKFVENMGAPSNLQRQCKACRWNILNLLTGTREFFKLKTFN